MIGFKRFSLAMAMEWPWAARIRYCVGSSEKLEGEDVGVEVEVSGTSVKRFLSFWAII